MGLCRATGTGGVPGRVVGDGKLLIDSELVPNAAPNISVLAAEAIDVNRSVN